MWSDLPFSVLPVVLNCRGDSPLKLDVTVTPSDEVQQLRQQIAILQQELSDLRTLYNRTEYLYRCETLINLQLADYCKEHGLKVPRRFTDKTRQPSA